MAQSRRLVILDLNGTLLDSTHRTRPGVRPHAKARHKNVYFRPYMVRFLEGLFEYYDVAVWTSNIRANAEKLVELAFTESQRKSLKFIWARDMCVLGANYSSTKPLDYVWDGFPQYTAATTRFVDDSSTKVVGTGREACHIQVEEFVASPESIRLDDELIALQQRIMDSFNSNHSADPYPRNTPALG